MARYVKEQSYKVGDLEELLYGGTLTATQLKAAKSKDSMKHTKNGAFYSDLYEGISLPYFLEQVVQLPVTKELLPSVMAPNNLEMASRKSWLFPVITEPPN